MAFQAVFQRYEVKYLLTVAQKERVLADLQRYMKLDKYGRTTIRNVYFDTDSYLLIRRSIEKPVYKEKMRIRSYCQATGESNVFVELKKKYKKVVFKRRILLPEHEAMRWIQTGERHHEDSQISREIEYFTQFYQTLKPRVFLSYEREAYYANDGSEFRVTFDENILCRQTDLSLTKPPFGNQILPPDTVLMELKCAGGIPLWMTEILSREKLFKTSFSKYGQAYMKYIYPTLNEEEMKEAI